MCGTLVPIVLPWRNSVRRHRSRPAPILLMRIGPGAGQRASTKPTAAATGPSPPAGGMTAGRARGSRNPEYHNREARRPCRRLQRLRAAHAAGVRRPARPREQVFSTQRLPIHRGPKVRLNPASSKADSSLFPCQGSGHEQAGLFFKSMKTRHESCRNGLDRIRGGITGLAYCKGA